MSRAKYIRTLKHGDQSLPTKRSHEVMHVTAQSASEMVIAMPSPPPDRRVLVNPMPLPGNVLGNERIRVVTYNLLASIYATQTQYPYCPSWALSWNFRKGQILRELAGMGTGDAAAPASARVQE